MKTKLTLFALLLAVTTITLCSIAIKSYNNRRAQKEVEATKNQVYEALENRYNKSDSAIAGTPKDSIGAKYSDVESRRFK